MIRNNVETIKWCGIMGMDEPKWRVVKVDVFEETRLRILPKIPKPIGRGPKVNTFHRLDLGMHDLSKLEDLPG